MCSNSIIRENVEIYEDVIQQLCELFIILGIHKDPIKIYETFIYMYTNGFLSNNGVYSDTDTIPEECINLEIAEYIKIDITGMILFYGYGVCRHTSDFLYHIYEKLGYNSSQIFTYHPLLSIQVYSFKKNLLTNYEAQKYIDEALIGLDLFSKEEIHFIKQFDNLLVQVDYLPENRKPLINHTMNIVIDEKDLSHILDTRYHCVGEKIDINRLKLNYKGLTHTDFIQENLLFHTYYRTNYYKGLSLLEYETNIEKDMLSSIIYQESCKKDIKYYKEFQLKNQKNYNTVANNIIKLAKKI